MPNLDDLRILWYGVKIRKSLRALDDWWHDRGFYLDYSGEVHILDPVMADTLSSRCWPDTRGSCLTDQELRWLDEWDTSEAKALYSTHARTWR